MFNLEEGRSDKIEGTKRNCWKWSEIVDVKLPEIASLLCWLENVINESPWLTMNLC